MRVRLLAVLFAVCLASAAEAQVGDAHWSAPASGCVPSDATTRFNRHKVGNASVRHAGRNVDKIILTCPIRAGWFDSPTDWLIALQYQVSTGNSVPGAFVQARLFRLPTGNNTDRPIQIAKVTSKGGGSTSLEQLQTFFSHSFNFLDNFYWVRVDLDRTSTSQTVIVHGVRLVGNPD